MQGESEGRSDAVGSVWEPDLLSSRCPSLPLLASPFSQSDDYVYSSLEIRETPEGLIYIKDLTTIQVLLRGMLGGRECNADGVAAIRG